MSSFLSVKRSVTRILTFGGAEEEEEEEKEKEESTISQNCLSDTSAGTSCDPNINSYTLLHEPSNYTLAAHTPPPSRYIYTPSKYALQRQNTPPSYYTHPEVTYIPRYHRCMYISVPVFELILVSIISGSFVFSRMPVRLRLAK